MDSPTLASPPLDCWPADSRPGTTPDTFGRAARRSKTFPNRRVHPFSVHSPGGDDTVRHNRVSECASGAANPTIEPSSFSFSISPGFSHVGGTVCEAFRDLNRFPKTGTPLCNSPRLGRVAGRRIPAANVIGPLRRAALTESCAAPTAPSQIPASRDESRNGVHLRRGNPISIRPGMREREKNGDRVLFADCDGKRRRL